MTDTPTVLAIVYESENNTLNYGTIALADKLAALGRPVEILDMKDPANFARLYQRLGAGDVDFVFGLQGVGSRLHIKGENLWTLAKTPFISIHYDHPSHALTNHVTESPYIVNLYNYDCFWNDYRDYVAPIKNQPRLGGRLPVACNFVESPPVPFDKREIKFLYLKTGNPLTPYETHINGLAPALRDGVWDRVRMAEKDPNLSLCDLACSLFDKDTFRAAENQIEFWAIVKAMDLYIRHKRALDFIEWIKMQDGAVIIGNGWDGVDKKHARATFKPSINALDAFLLYRQTQIVCNTNPYGFDMIHERTVLALLHECGVITDTNKWTEATFADTPSVIRFDWHNALDQQIGPQCEALFAAPDNLAAARQKTLDLFVHDKAERALIAYAEKTRDFVTSTFRTTSPI